jgi:hypothetical protein
MKPMNPGSARTLTVLSSVLTLFGGMVMSPSGSLFLLVMASMAAFFPAVFGRKAIRLLALFILLISLFLMAIQYPVFRQDQDTYRRHSEARSFNSLKIKSFLS